MSASDPKEASCKITLSVYLRSASGDSEMWNTFLKMVVSDRNLFFQRSIFRGYLQLHKGMLSEVILHGYGVTSSVQSLRGLA